MFRLSNISIGIKLSVMSGLGILFVVGIIAAMVVGGGSVKTSGDLADLQAEIGRGVLENKASIRGLQMGVKDMRLSQDEQQLQTAAKYVESRLLSVHKFADPLIPKFRNPANRARLEKIVALSEQYAKRAKEIVPLRMQYFAAQAAQKKLDMTDMKAYLAAESEMEKFTNKQTEISGETLAMASELEKLAEEASHNAEKNQAEAHAAASATSIFVELLSLGLGVLTMLVLVCAAFLGAFTIARPLKALVKPLEEVAGGNFAITVPGVGRKDEVGQIAGAVAQMAEKVSSTIAEIKASGREVTNASAEISTSTTDLSQRTEEQAASLEETSAAMEELSATVRKNSENAQLANTDANNTRDVADRGGKVVAKAVEAMARIEDSSRKISDIIGVIDEIARQTNLLALNAAVEAARAGEAGRGFAVVASEVRSLAQRSSQAAKDIKDLITNSNGQVKDGVELVNKAGESLSEIVESIKKVAVVVSDIANASIEQATGIEQINKALTQMDEVTQQNSALVEENAATAKTLEHQAKAMDEQVAFFQIGDGTDRHDAPHTPAATKPAIKPAVRSSAKVRPVAKAPAAAQGAAQGAGPARQMQTALATAVGQDWKEF